MMHSSKSLSLRFAALAFAAWVAAMDAVSAQDAALDYRIAEQSLGQALREFALASNLDLLFSPDLVAGKKSSSLDGKFTVDEGLRTLLRGSGLEFSVSGSRVVISEPKIEPERQATSSAPQGTNGYMLLAQAETGSPQSSVSSRVSAENSQATGKERIELEEIVVTGSRLARSPDDEASPVTVFSAADIRKTGASTVAEVLGYLPQASVNVDGTRLGSFLGSTPVQLRGLRAGSTLVLVDGRRAQPSPYSGAGFDLSTIPLGIVERIEVLSDSASAIYGADAIAGVVNVILKSEVDGIQVDARFDDTSAFEAGQERLTASGGFSVGRFTGLLAVDYLHRSALSGDRRDRISDQDYARFGGDDFRTTCSGLANVFSVTDDNLPGLNASFAGVPRGAGDRLLTPADFSTTAGALNVCSSVETGLISPGERYGFLGKGEYRLTDTLVVFENLFASRLWQDATSPPPVVFAVVPDSNPFNPFDVPVRVGYGVVDLGLREERQTTDSLRGVLGVRGRFAASWRWELAGLATQEETAVRDPLGTVDPVAFTALLNQTDSTRTVNVFRDGPGAAQRDLLLATVIPTKSDWRIDSRQVDAQASGSVLPLPGGDLRMAIGSEFRNERLDQTTGSGGSVDATRDVSSAFLELSLPIVGAEMAVPLVRRLQLTVAGRYDDYSDFGTTANPKYGMLWAPLSFVDVRATYSTSYRAPTLANLYAPQTILNVGLNDRRRGELTTVPVTRGGNPELQPEEGEAHNVGIVIRPPVLPNLTMSADRWKIRQSARVITTGFQTVLDFESLFPDRITRAPPTPQDQQAGLPGRILALNGSTLNFGAAEVEGTDLRISYTHLYSLGEFGFTASASHVRHFMAAIRPGAALQNRLGQAFTDGFAPRWKATGSVEWTRGGNSATLTARYIDHYLDYDGGRTLKSQTLFDFQTALTLFPADVEDLKLTLGARNILNAEPPFSNGSFGYDPQQYDLIGRTFYAAVSKRF